MERIKKKKIKQQYIEVSNSNSEEAETIDQDVELPEKEVEEVDDGASKPVPTDEQEFSTS